MKSLCFAVALNELRPRPFAVAETGVDDESVLVAALKRDNAEAFETLVRMSASRLLAVARRFTGNDEDARDCVQEAFLAVHSKIADFEERSSLSTWLHRIVVNAALSRLRAKQRRPEESLDELMPRDDRYGYLIGSPPEHSAEELLERVRTENAVRGAVDQLPADYRAVLLLRDLEGYDTREVSELLGINPGAVKTRLHRARAALRALLEPILVSTPSEQVCYPMDHPVPRRSRPGGADQAQAPRMILSNTIRA